MSKTFFDLYSYLMDINKTTNIELRQLRSFLAVAQEMNFTRAAQALHIAQPPLSRQIRELEDVLGAGLFERTTRSVSLTAAGNAFLAEVQKLLPQLEYAVEAARRAARGQQGRLHLGYTGRASQSLLPTLLREFHASYPDVSVDIDGPYPTGYLREKLLVGHLDVALCFLPVAGDALRSVRLMSTPLAIALPATHALASRATVRIQELSGESFVAYPSGQGFHLRGAMEALCQSAGFRPRVVRETDASQTLLCLVAAGTGVAIIPAETQFLLTEGVVFKKLRAQAGTLEHGAVWMASNSNPALHNLLKIAMGQKASHEKQRKKKQNPRG